MADTQSQHRFPLGGDGVVRANFGRGTWGSDEEQIAHTRTNTTANRENAARYNDFGKEIGMYVGDLSYEERAAKNREALARYNVECTEPDHRIFGRAARNRSARCDGDTLNAMRDALSLHGSTEPLQTNWTDSVDALGGSEREYKQEMRPTAEELVKLCTTDVEYEKRIVRDGPQLSRCGYATAHGFREMVIPIGGDVICYGITAAKRMELEACVRDRLGAEATQQELDLEVARMAPRSTSISFNDRSSKWALHRAGGCRFAINGGGQTTRGALTEYSPDAGKHWFKVKDEFTAPKGGESLDGSDKNFWAPYYPREPRTIKRTPMRGDPTKPVKLERADADKAFADWRASAPANDNRAAACDGMPYDLKSFESWRIAAYGYSFGRKCAPKVASTGRMNVAFKDDADEWCNSNMSVKEIKQPAYDILARLETRGEFRLLLSDQSLLVFDAIRGDNDNEPLQNNADVGRLLAEGKELDRKTLERRGKAAVDKAVTEIRKVCQLLAA